MAFCKSNKKFLLLLLIFLINGKSLYSQDENNKTYTLNQCIEFAINNHPSVNKAKIEKKIADADIGVTRASGLPQVNGTAEIAHNTELRPIFFKSNSRFAQSFIPPSTPKGEIIAQENPLRLPTSGEVSLSVNQMIFNGSYFVGLQASKTYKDLKKKTVQQKEKDVIQSVAKNYYSVLINKERIELLNKNISRVDSLLKQTKTLYNNGYVEKIDVNRVKVNLNNLQSEQKKLNNSITLSKYLLKYQMGMKISKPMKLKGSIDSLEKEDFLIIKEDNNKYQERIEYSILQTQKRLYQLDLKNARVSYLPSLNFFGNAGYINQNDGIEKELFTNEWLDFSLIGIKMNIPIFSGAERHYQIQKAKLNLEKNRENFKELENSIDIQIKRAKTQLKNSLETLKSQKENMELAKEVVENTRKKYKQGMKDNLEVVSAETDYKEARVNYFNALFKAYSNKIDYLKAKGKLTANSFK